MPAYVSPAHVDSPKKGASVAIAFVRAKVISRKAGQSAVACAAYRSGDRLEDERYGKTHDYKRKENILAQGWYLPDYAPHWSRAQLWNEVERAEKRADAQLSKEFILALPHELTTMQHQEIIDKVCEYLTGQGMIVDWAIHGAPRQGDERNIHAHLMTTMRELTPEGFGNKNREWNSKAWLKDFRAVTLDIMSEYLQERLVFVENLELGKPKSQHLGPSKFNELRRLNRASQEIKIELAAIETELNELAKPAQEPVKIQARPEPKPEQRPAQPQPVRTEQKLQPQPQPQPVAKPKTDQELYIEEGQRLLAMARAGRAKEALQGIKKLESHLETGYIQILTAKAEEQAAEHRKKLKQVQAEAAAYEKHIKQAKAAEPWRYEYPAKNLPDKPPLFGRKEYEQLKQQHQDIEERQKFYTKNEEAERQVKDKIANITYPEFIKINARKLVKQFCDAVGLTPIIDEIKSIARKLSEHLKPRDNERGRS